jgi:hypothetical protein
MRRCSSDDSSSACARWLREDSALRAARTERRRHEARRGPRAARRERRDAGDRDGETAAEARARPRAHQRRACYRSSSGRAARNRKSFSSSKEIDIFASCGLCAIWRAILRCGGRFAIVRLDRVVDGSGSHSARAASPNRADERDRDRRCAAPRCPVRAADGAPARGPLRCRVDARAVGHVADPSRSERAIHDFTGILDQSERRTISSEFGQECEYPNW